MTHLAATNLPRKGSVSDGEKLEEVLRKNKPSLLHDPRKDRPAAPRKHRGNTDKTHNNNNADKHLSTNSRPASDVEYMSNTPPSHTPPQGGSSRTSYNSPSNDLKDSASHEGSKSDFQTAREKKQSCNVM